MRYSRALSFSTLVLLVETGSSFLTPLRRTAVTSWRDFPACNLRSRRANQPQRALSDTSSDSGIDNEEDMLLLEKQDLTESLLVYLFPVVATVSAFTLYEGTSHAFHALVDSASHQKWYPVDGGALIGDIILPAINGPVLGTIGLLFATLVSTTIGNLYQRQMSISRSIVKEVDDLRRLGYLFQSLPEPYRREAQMELKKFVNQIFAAASKRNIGTSFYRDVTLTPMFLLLNKISCQVEMDESIKVSGYILDEAYTLIRRINDERTAIAVLLRPAFPPLHYVNLIALGTCICLVFLIETDRDLIFFLAGFQLRMLWSILIGIFAMVSSACIPRVALYAKAWSHCPALSIQQMATVIYDLESPFGGSYNAISSTDRELEFLKEYVTRSWED